MGIPDSLLLATSELSPEELRTMKRHPEYGWAILRSIPGFERASLLVLHHQEWLDGSGYPSGLQGDEIPLGARIVAVVDRFEEMVADRPDRPGLPPAQAFEQLREAAGSRFDPVVVERFIEVARERLGTGDPMNRPSPTVGWERDRVPGGWGG